MLFYIVEVAWLPKFLKASCSTKQLVYRLKHILAVVFCTQILTVAATNVVVGKELFHSNYPCIHPFYEKYGTFFVYPLAFLQTFSLNVR